MQGKMPPLVMESIGGWVRNVQLIARHPLLTRKKTTVRSAAPFIRAASLNKKNIDFWVVRLRFRLVASDFTFLLSMFKPAYAL